jgi:hypothetical protein
VAVVAVVLLSFGIVYAIAAQPHMNAALNLLQSARAELVQAVPNKGGHRERAIDLVDRAIKQVKAGIASGAN